MKLWYSLSGAALAVVISGCADKSSDIATPTLGSQVSGQTATLKQPSVSGNVLIRQRVALPPDAVLTVTVSDASVADAPSRIIAQRVVRTSGKQSPFHFELPFNPADVQPGANVLLSAAITINGKLAFVTETVQPVITRGGTKKDLTLVAVPSVSVPTATGAASTVPATSPTQVTPLATVPASTTM